MNATRNTDLGATALPWRPRPQRSTSPALAERLAELAARGFGPVAVAVFRAGYAAAMHDQARGFADGTRRR
jgi:hypothetical protein